VLPNHDNRQSSSAPAKGAAGEVAITCPACRGTGALDFFHIERLPVHVGILFDSPEEARRTPTGEILLAWCPTCDFIFNRKFEPAKGRLSFQRGYEISLVHSELFRSFLNEVGGRLIERFGLRGKTIFEIGCGTGYFLRLLCRLGGNSGIGVDPTVEREGLETVPGGEIRWIRDYFSDRYAELPVDFICCLSVFEDISDPIDFLGMVHWMAERCSAGIYFEVFNGYRAIATLETWSIHYEQCNYFGLRSFRSLFERCGFRVTDSALCYGGDQYIYVEAVPEIRGSEVARSDGEGKPRTLPEELRRFAEIHEQRWTDWKARIAGFRERSCRIVVWGSGGKGISWLNGVDPQGSIPYVVDINPARQGKYIPGSGQKIIAPESLLEYRPDVVILTNPLYEREIREQAGRLGLKSEFHVA